MYNNFKVCHFFIKFCVPSFIPDVFMALINQPLRVSLPSVQTVSVFPGNRRVQRVNEGRFCTGHMSGQPRHVEQGKGCDCQLLNHAGPWDQSHSVTRKDGAGFRGCGSVEGDVGGVEGWVGWKGDRSDLKLQRQSAQEGSMSDFLGVSEVWGWLTPEGRQLRCLWRKACTGVWMAPCCSFVGNSENAPSWHSYYILMLMHSGVTSQIWPECLVGILLTVKNAWETDCIHSRRICAIHWLSNMYKQCQYCVTVYSTALSLLLIKVNALMFG